MKRLDIEKNLERRRRKTDTTLAHMVRFIEQEGHEKAEEINAKTEEEFNIEKGKIVQTSRIIIKRQYDKMEENCDREEKIKTGLKQTTCIQLLLTTKQNHLDQMRNEIEQRVLSDLSCSKRRWYILEKLIMEGLFRLLEPKVKICCRQVDAHAIGKYIPLIESQYRLHAKKPISLVVDQKYLSQGSLPGVILSSESGKVVLNNTLEARITQIIEFCTPLLSSIFYGTSRMKTTTTKA